MGTLSVATLNVRNTADGWRRRRPLLVDQLVALDPDVVALQELRMVPDQAAAIARHAVRAWADDRPMRRLRAPKRGVMGLWEGVGVLSRLPVVERGVLDLRGQGRVALRVTVRAPGGGVVEIYDAHLASVGEELRRAQAARILDWMATRPTRRQVLLGDLNSRPGSPTIEHIGSRLRSAHVEAHGVEPDRTAPTALRRDYAGDGAVLDYIFVGDDLEVLDCRVAFDECDPHDHTLMASDHLGLVATLAPRHRGP